VARRLEYLFVRFLLVLLRCISYGASLRLARSVAHMAWLFNATPRTRVMDNLSLAYGGAMEQGKARKITLGVFETITRHVAEIAHVAREAERGVRIENGELLKEAYARGRGVVVVSAHMGCFIRMVLIPRLLGVRAAVIMKKQRNDVLLQWGIRYLKAQFDLEVIPKKEARERIVQRLEEGGVVALFADQHPRKGGFPARFFGREIMAAGGPAVYAKRFNCPLVVFTATLQPDGTQVLRFDGPISTEGTHAEVSQRWLDQLEARIREHPEQWMWMHRRWRGAAAVAAVPAVPAPAV